MPPTEPAWKWPLMIGGPAIILMFVCLWLQAS